MKESQNVFIMLQLVLLSSQKKIEISNVSASCRTDGVLHASTGSVPVCTKQIKGLPFASTLQHHAWNKL